MMTHMLKSLNKLDNDKSKDYIRNNTEIGKSKEIKPKTMDFLFIKRLLYIKHEIDENLFTESLYR